MNGSTWIPLQSSDLIAEIDPLGAQLSVLRDRGGRDLLWDGDPGVWKGRAPLLFPIVGALAGGSYRLGSKTYRLPRHGFARGRQFAVTTSTRTTAVFELAADKESFEVYPFRFALEVRFELDGPTFSVTATVRNNGDQSMPASFGYHPALRWPLPFGGERSRHVIEFERDEPAPIRRLDADGLVTPVAHATPISNRRLVLADSLFQDDAVIFDQIRSRSVIYGADVGPRLRMSYPDAPYLGIWTKPGAPFICIEPWHGLADPEGFSGDFSAKPGVFVVSPDADVAIKMSITLLAG
ncbi:MAG: aldose 1-epimerase family protein [Steroidobacteraceae bacterium]